MRLDELHRLAKKTPTLTNRKFFVPSSARIRQQLRKRGFKKKYFALAVMVKGRLVGITSDPLKGSRGYSGHIFILPEYQRGGVGRLFFEEKIRRLVALGARTLVIKPITEGGVRIAKTYVHARGQRFVKIQTKQGEHYVLRL